MKFGLRNILLVILTFGVSVFASSLIFGSFFNRGEDIFVQPATVNLAKMRLERFAKAGNCEGFLGLINNFSKTQLDESEIDFQNQCVIKARKEGVAKAKALAADKKFFAAAAAIDDFFKLTKHKDNYLSELKNMYVEFDQQSKSALEKYEGSISHIFFHSLIAYPKMAFDNDPESINYQANMVTTTEFKKILDQLYANGYILINIESLTKEDASTKKFIRQPISLPKNKKPLIMSFDDLNYFFYDKKDGFAEKLVFDENESVATLVDDSQGDKKITRDGDYIPILDDFILTHPDFSFMGQKGILALTGFRGIFGYDTYNIKAANYSGDLKRARQIADELKATGWQFASHSYSHAIWFKDGSISYAFLKKDLQRWQNEVGTITGATNIFIGPFGQTFRENDPRRTLLVENNYNIICGVDIKMPTYLYKGYFISDRMDIDGSRMVNNSRALSNYFDVKTVYDSSRPVKINY